MWSLSSKNFSLTSKKPPLSRVLERISSLKSTHSVSNFPLTITGTCAPWTNFMKWAVTLSQLTSPISSFRVSVTMRRQSMEKNLESQQSPYTSKCWKRIRTFLIQCSRLLLGLWENMERHYLTWKREPRLSSICPLYHIGHWRMS